MRNHDGFQLEYNAFEQFITKKAAGTKLYNPICNYTSSKWMRNKFYTSFFT